MIAFIKGEIIDIYTDRLIIENNGIGYSVFVTSRLLSSVLGSGETIKLHTYFNVKEDSMTLFGFSDKDELELFKKLIGVSKIGPKGALSILSCMSINELSVAILSEDAKAISKAPGIGVKTASRIIIELKDKIDYEDILSTNIMTENGLEENVNLRNDAAEALASLGYSPSQALNAMKSINITEDDSVEMIIKKALKKLV